MGRITNDNIIEVLTYHVPNALQIDSMNRLCEKQLDLAKTILELVPDCADRTTALRKLREVRMDCNAAIVLNGLI